MLSLLPLAAVLLCTALIFNRLSALRYLVAVSTSDLLTDVAELGSAFDAFVAAQPAPVPAPDLQPVADAIVAQTARIKASTPAPVV